MKKNVVECNPRPIKHVKVEPIRIKLPEAKVKAIGEDLKKIYKVTN